MNRLIILVAFLITAVAYVDALMAGKAHDIPAYSVTIQSLIPQIERDIIVKGLTETKSAQKIIRVMKATEQVADGGGINYVLDIQLGETQCLKADNKNGLLDVSCEPSKGGIQSCTVNVFQPPEMWSRNEISMRCKS